MPNLNTLWANIFVDELARSGLKAVCAAPGSRHTPLMLAFAQHEQIKVYSHLDERSASFFALGLALASDEPVALVCTSGTAGANFFPAIIEAHQSRVPLIVITADRPPELRHSGANQTIDQIKMFGDYALWFVDVALPEAKPSSIAIRNLRTTAARAFARANGIRKGVVHINMPFRKPLEPTPVESDVVELPEGALAREDGLSYTHFSTPAQLPDSSLITYLAEILDNHEGIIVGGPNRGNDAFAEAAAYLANATGYPLFVDGLSNLRFFPDVAGMDLRIAGYETFLPAASASFKEPEVVLRLGNVPTSKNLNAFLDQINPKYRIHISNDAVWADDGHRQSNMIQANTTKLCERLGEILWDKVAYPLWIMPLTDTLESETWRIIDDEIATGVYFDGGVVYDVVDLIPAESTLFMGNSLPVRLLDQFGKPMNKRIYTYANRGASGIDGNTSTALGAGAARPDHPLVAVVGDITFYHDMNGLLAVHRCGIPITIVLLNNDGGGIFHRLPIKNYEPEFTDYFVTPHGLDFSHAAKMYGLDYIRADDRKSFRQAFTESVSKQTSCIIEVRTDAGHNEQRRQEIVAAVQERIREVKW